MVVYSILHSCLFLPLSSCPECPIRTLTGSNHHAPTRRILLLRGKITLPPNLTLRRDKSSLPNAQPEGASQTRKPRPTVPCLRPHNTPACLTPSPEVAGRRSKGFSTKNAAECKPWGERASRRAKKRQCVPPRNSNRTNGAFEFPAVCCLPPVKSLLAVCTVFFFVSSNK